VYIVVSRIQQRLQLEILANGGSVNTRLSALARGSAEKPSYVTRDDEIHVLNAVRSHLPLREALGENVAYDERGCAGGKEKVKANP
jgi:hypothetical protein